MYKKVISNYLMPARVATAFMDRMSFMKYTPEMRTGQVVLAFCDSVLGYAMPKPVAAEVKALQKDLQTELTKAPQKVRNLPKDKGDGRGVPEDEGYDPYELPYEHKAADKNPYDGKVSGMVKAVHAIISDGVVPKKKFRGVPEFIDRIKGYDISPKVLDRLVREVDLGERDDGERSRLWKAPSKLEKVLDTLPNDAKEVVMDQAQKVFTKFKVETGEQMGKEWMKRFDFKSTDEVTGFLVVKCFVDFFGRNSRLELPEGISMSGLEKATAEPSVGAMPVPVYNSYKEGLSKFGTLIPKEKAPAVEPKDEKKPEEKKEPGKKEEPKKDEEKKPEEEKTPGPKTEKELVNLKDKRVPIFKPLSDAAEKLQDKLKKDLKLPANVQKDLLDELETAVGEFSKSAAVLPHVVQKIIDKIKAMAPDIQKKMMGLLTRRVDLGRQTGAQELVWKDPARLEQALESLSEEDRQLALKQTEKILGMLAWDEA